MKMPQNNWKERQLKMKQFHKRVCSLALSLAMALILAVPAYAEIYDYELEGGNLRFDAATGTIIACSASLRSVTIPSDIYGVPVTAIGEKAFQGRNMLTSVEIPSTVTKIAQGAFSGCRQLKSITIPGGVITLADSPDQFTGIFHECYNLESITIAGSVKRIPSYIFTNCESLKNVTLEYGVEEIGSYAFYNCKNLESITLPDSIQRIETLAFQYCPGLTEITLGSSLKTIAKDAFYETPNLLSLYFRGNAPSATAEMVGYKGLADGAIVYYPTGSSGWTTPTWNGYVTRSYTPSGVTPAPEMTAVTAVPTTSAVLVNGQKAAFDAYNINGNNYFKLRDLALTLSSTSARFDVVWSQDLGAVLMTSGKSYTPVGGEMRPGSSLNQTGVLNSSKVYLDGQTVDLTAYTILGSNYFKLRDIGQLFNFSVEWDGANRQIMIDTSKPYGG